MRLDPAALSRLKAALAQVPPGERPALIGRAIATRAGREGLGLLYRTGAYRLAPLSAKGRGVILLFHEVHEDVGRELMVGSELRHVMNAVQFCRRDGRDIVGLDEALRRVRDPASRPFAVLTFDDGYRDIRERVLPALAAAEAPFTVFVPTATLTRDLSAWWLGLRQVFQDNDIVRVAAMDREFRTGSRAEKVIGLRAATAWITADLGRADDLGPTFRTYGVDLPSLVADRMLSADELREVASHPLVTIGGHTDSHPALALLPEDEAAGELSRNKAFLENLLGRGVDHVAYPYGGPSACGAREARLARRGGFRTGVTTRAGTLHDRDDDAAPFSWPREDVGYPGQTAATLAAHCYGLSGLLP